MRLQTAKMPGIGLKVAGKPANSRLNSRVNSNWPHQHVPKWLKQTFLSRLTDATTRLTRAGSRGCISLRSCMRRFTRLIPRWKRAPTSAPNTMQPLRDNRPDQQALSVHLSSDAYDATLRSGHGNK